MEKHEAWLSDPDNVKLAEYLVEKTKEVKEVLSVVALAKDFKEESVSLLEESELRNRLLRFRLVIHKFPHFDIETKVKLLFALSGPVDQGFLNELKKKADVKLDDNHRITHYKTHGGGLELNGKHRTRKAEASNNQILEFLAKKSAETSEIFSTNEILTQFKTETGNQQNIGTLRSRFSDAKTKIYESELFDEDTKVRMMFATKAKVPRHVFEKLQENALVVLSDTNRIKEYQKKDGSLKLKWDDRKRSSAIYKKNDADDSDDGDVEEEHGDSSDEEVGTMDTTTRSGRLSKKRISDASIFTKNGPSSSTPNTGNRKRKAANYSKESARKKRRTDRERTPEDELDDDYSFDFSYQSNNQVKVEPFDGPLKMDMTRGAVINDGDDFVEELPARTEHFEAPKYEERLMNVKMEEPDAIILNDPIDTEKDPVEDVLDDYVAPNSSDNHQGSSSESTDHIDQASIAIDRHRLTDQTDSLDNSVAPDSSNNHPKEGQGSTSSEDVKTPLKLLLESFRDVIELLDLPILSDIQKKIEAELEKCTKAPKVRMVSSEIIDLSLKLCLVKVKESCEMKETNGIDSISFKKFVLHLKNVVNAVKVPILGGLLKTLESMTEELREQDKVAPVTSVRNALQITIDSITTY